MGEPVTQLISITIPVLNEEDSLSRQIREVRTFLDTHLKQFGPIEIVIADNGSSDSTPILASALSRELANVTSLRLEERGVGKALKASWGHSESSIVGYMDLDLATDLSALEPALSALVASEASIVTGTRLASTSKVLGRSLKRNITTRVFNRILKTAFGTEFTDGMCGFKFLRRDCLPQLTAWGATNDGWFFATEMLVAGERSGLRVLDLPVRWTDDPNSKVRIGALSIEYLKDIRALRSHLKEMEQGV